MGRQKECRFRVQGARKQHNKDIIGCILGGGRMSLEPKLPAVSEHMVSYITENDFCQYKMEKCWTVRRATSTALLEREAVSSGVCAAL